MKDYKFPPELLTRSPGHYRDWIRACKGGDPACSNFNVAAPFVEWMLLGVVALRVEGKIEQARHAQGLDPGVNAFLRPVPWRRRGTGPAPQFPPAAVSAASDTRFQSGGSTPSRLCTK